MPDKAVTASIDKPRGVSNPMRIYVAGPMRYHKDFNFPAFADAAVRLRALGHEVFSPAERDLSEVGSIFGSETGDLEEILARGFSLREALAADMAWIALKADALAVLPGWEDSLGACAEVALARALALPVAPVDAYWPSGPDPRAVL